MPRQIAGGDDYRLFLAGSDRRMREPEFAEVRAFGGVERRRSQESQAQGEKRNLPHPSILSAQGAAASSAAQGSARRVSEDFGPARKSKDTVFPKVRQIVEK
jgi:hypothetical protein